MSEQTFDRLKSTILIRMWTCNSCGRVHHMHYIHLVRPAEFPLLLLHVVHVFVCVRARDNGTWRRLAE